MKWFASNELNEDLGRKSNQDLEQKFRRAVFEKCGMKKGNIQFAAIEALNEWISKRERESKKKQTKQDRMGA